MAEPAFEFVAVRAGGAGENPGVRVQRRAEQAPVVSGSGNIAPASGSLLCRKCYETEREDRRGREERGKTESVWHGNISAHVGYIW